MRSFVRCHGLLLPLSTPQITNKIEAGAAPSCCTGSIQAELEGRHASEVLVQHGTFGCVKDKHPQCSLCSSFLVFVVIVVIVVVVVGTLASPADASIQPGTPQIPSFWRKKEEDRK